MRLRNLKTLSGELIDIFLPDSKSDDEHEISFTNAIAFPGFINSHDHLDFNLFQSYGEKKYSSYHEWANYIHCNYSEEINKVLRIPVHLRAQWGIYKNLLCGVTTVVNHGAKLQISDPIISVLQHTQSLHSVQFERLWKLKLNNPIRRKRLSTIHIGEGTDERSFREINTLTKWNFLRKEIVGIHAVAMKKHQSRKFKAIVWCPMSNYFLFDKTAPVEELDTKILFGTDSTLTAPWNIWEHLRFVKEETSVSNAQLLNMLIASPGAVWNIPGYNGDELPSDIVIADFRNKTEDDFFSLNPEDILIVIHKGKVALFDSSIKCSMTEHVNMDEFSAITINGKTKWVKGDLPKLISSIKEYHPQQSFSVEIGEL